MLDEKRNTELCIHPFYEMREKPEAFDDRKMRDEWQDDVYRLARLSMDSVATRVVDFGCGSGFKLMKYFSACQTVGHELEPTLSYLKATYPDREWRGDYPKRFTGDVFICADVLEHMLDPTELLRRLADSTVGLMFLSTPALDILVEQGRSPRLGPPDNKSHVNEWTVLEFRSYIAMYLDILEHMVPNCEQGTQLIVARRK